MIYEFQARLVVQKELKFSKYFLQVVSASCTQNSTIPYAEIEVIATNGKDIDYLTDIEFLDIVWLEVSIRFGKHERIVWKKIFEGRIITRREQWGNGTTATITCLGHAYEPSVRVIPESSNFGSTTDSMTILNVVRTYLARSELVMPVVGSTFSTTYNIKAYQKYINDVMEDMITISGDTYFYETRCVYSSSKFLTGTSIYYKHVPETVTNKYAIRSGTPRLYEAHFESDGGDVWNYVIQLGNSPTEGTQYLGSALDSERISRYGSRELVNVDTSLTSNDMCSKLAGGKLQIVQDPIVTGSVTLFLTPEAHYKDLVRVTISQIQVSNEELSRTLGNVPLDRILRVSEVTHKISADGCTTELKFGVDLTQDDWTAEFKRNNRIAMSQFVE